MLNGWYGIARCLPQDSAGITTCFFCVGKVSRVSSRWLLWCSGWLEGHDKMMLVVVRTFPGALANQIGHILHHSYSLSYNGYSAIYSIVIMTGIFISIKCIVGSGSSVHAMDATFFIPLCEFLIRCIEQNFHNVVKWQINYIINSGFRCSHRETA